MRYLLGFSSVLLLVGLINSIGYSSFSQDRAMAVGAVVGHIKESVLESIKLYGVGLLLIKLLS